MANPETNRARRFSLPDLGNERADEAISAFLTGPDRRRGRPGGMTLATDRGNPFAALENRLAWTEALRRESARSLRYRRPTAVMVIAGQPAAETPQANDWLGRVAAPIAHALRRGTRDTDLVTRTALASFQVLLPETTGPEAAHVADRVLADCDVWLHAVGAPVTLRAATAGTTPEFTLDAALEQALKAIDGR
jgi:PleD family two-component response regulator